MNFIKCEMKVICVVEVQGFNNELKYNVLELLPRVAEDSPFEAFFITRLNVGKLSAEQIETLTAGTEINIYVTAKID